MGSEPSTCIEYISRVSESITNHLPETQPIIKIFPSKEKVADCTCS